MRRKPKQRRKCSPLVVAAAVAAGSVVGFAEPSSAAAAVPGHFAYATFEGAPGLELGGSASVVDGALRLTDSRSGETGTAWYTSPVSTYNSFESRITFSLHDAFAGGVLPGDGVAFVLQSSLGGSSALGRGGSGMGYGDITDSVEVEFDVWQDEFDPDPNHVAVTVDGDETSYLAYADPPFQMYDKDGGRPFTAWIDYDQSSHSLSVYMSRDVATKPATATLRTTVDLGGVAASGAPTYVGLTAGTGFAYETADVIDWRYDVAPLTPSVIRGGDLNVVTRTGSVTDGEVCTAGFAAVHDGRRYVVTANHCRGGKQAVDVSGLAVPQPVEGEPLAWTRYATAVRCRNHSTPTCLTASNLLGQQLDAMAWLPDAAGPTPVAELQTDSSVYPVLGSGDWKLGQNICSMGIKSKIERCGQILAKAAFDSNLGYVKWKMPDLIHYLGGDSGGPVYLKKYSRAGAVLGVYILGINEGTNKSHACNVDQKCTNFFLPVATIMNALGVSVLANS